MRTIDDRSVPRRVTDRAAEWRLVQRVLRGEPAAERAFYDAHVDRVYRLCHRLSGDEALAQEYTQETFIRAFAGLGRFRGDASLSTWLHAIAVSVTLNGQRKIRRIRAREVEFDQLPEVASNASSPRDPDLRERLRRAIDALPEIYRVVFLMHDAEGYTHEEIGRTLDVATGTSKARLSRARARLREALADFAEEFAR